MVYGILLSVVAKPMVLNKYAIRQERRSGMEMTNGVLILLIVLCIVLAVGLVCCVLAICRYGLHISAKKIEILPSKESPKSKR